MASKNQYLQYVCTTIYRSSKMIPRVLILTGTKKEGWGLKLVNRVNKYKYRYISILVMEVYLLYFKTSLTKF